MAISFGVNGVARLWVLPIRPKLTNAIEAMHPVGKSTRILKFTASATQPDAVLIGVRDSGIGRLLSANAVSED